MKSAQWVSGWVTVFFPNDISGLRKLKKVKFGTKVASSTRIMCALRFLKSFLIVAKFAKNRLKGAHSSLHATSDTKNSRNAEIGINTTHGVKMMPEPFVFKLCSALL